MRNLLLSTVATAALSLSGVLALAQDRAPGGAAPEKPAAAEKTAPAAPSAPKSPSAEPRREGQANDTKAGASPSHAQQSGESNPRAGESKAGAGSSEKTNAASEPKAPAAKTNATTETKGSGTANSNAATDTKAPGAPKTNATTETKGAGTPNSNTGAAKPSTAAAPNPTNEPGKAATTQPSNANPAATTGNAAQQPGAAARTGNAGPNPPGAANQGGSNVNASVNIEPQQQTKIVETLRTRHADAVTNVNFSVSVGASVPETVRFRPLPEDIVAIVPQYRGYNFVIVHDEVVIIEPRTRKIVTVLHQGGSGGARRASFSIPMEKRSKIRTEVINSYHGPRDAKFEVRVGERLPDDIRLETFPDTVYAEDPDLRSYEYVVVRDEVVLVEPQTREIVEVLD
ncbi:MAG: DUF1236 domain-containing protein [Beijerinckiaceae bacterium]